MAEVYRLGNNIHSFVIRLLDVLVFFVVHLVEIEGDFGGPS